MKSRRGLTALIVLIFVTTQWIVLGIRRNKELESGFDKIVAGMSREKVTALIGSPSRVQRNCDEAIVFRARPNFAQCSEEDVYPISFTVSDHWEIYFDKQGRVLYITAILSP
jgi:hypothetical protein